MNAQTTALLFAVGTFASTGAGGLLALRFRDRLRILLGFSAGAIVALVFFDLLPSVFAYAEGRQAMMATALGFLSFFLLERYTSLHKAREHHAALPGHASELGTLSAAGLCLHSFLDGIAIGVGFHASFSTGTTIALAIILHDMSDGLNTVTVVLAHNRNQLRRCIIWLAIDMVAPILGVASTLLFNLPMTIIPWLLAFFAGFFLYMGASDLLPEARQSTSPMIAVATVSGMVLVFLLCQILPK